MENPNEPGRKRDVFEDLQGAGDGGARQAGQDAVLVGGEGAGGLLLDAVSEVVDAAPVVAALVPAEETAGDHRLRRVPEGKRTALTGILAQDPRPQYQNDPERIYAMAFAGLEIKFRVAGDVLTVVAVE